MTPTQLSQKKWFFFTSKQETVKNNLKQTVPI